MTARKTKVLMKAMQAMKARKVMMRAARKTKVARTMKAMKAMKARKTKVAKTMKAKKYEVDKKFSFYNILSCAEEAIDYIETLSPVGQQEILWELRIIRNLAQRRAWEGSVRRVDFHY